MYRRDFVKLGVTAAAACLGASALSGCAGTATKEYGERTVRVATGGTGEPYSFIDSKGTWTGFCADAWSRVKEITGWTIETVNSYSADSALSDVLAGSADVAANGFYITSKRLEIYLACDPLFADVQVVAVKSDSGYEKLEDLRGKTIGVTTGTEAQQTANALAATYGWTVSPYSNITAGVKDCAAGTIDGYLDTAIDIRGAEQTQGTQLTFVGDALAGSNVAWFLTTKETELRDELNKVIAKMHEDGSLSELCTKWFGEDLTGYSTDPYPKASR